MAVFRFQNEARSLEGVHRLGPLEVLALAGWCGLAAGELEVAARVASRTLSSTLRLYLMTRHFVWLVPLINLVVFLGLGALLSLAVWLWPRRAGWLGPRLLIGLAIFPVLMTLSTSIYPEAWLLLATGLAFRLAPWLEQPPKPWRRWLAFTTPILMGLVLIQAGWIFGDDWAKQKREDNRPMPGAGSPNVLLIVLDTVRADHLSLHGYQRPTTPNLERLAGRGILFNRARAAAPWTLASHANFFTGKWPHELGVKWSSPLRRDVPTLAGHLGSLGYATAGFAGNTFYCSYDTGLDRGFTCFQDYGLSTLDALKTVGMLNETLKAIDWLGRLFTSKNSGSTPSKLAEARRKSADIVNHQFLDWLSQRLDPQRPFFAFLNYVDAHSPYLLPEGVSYQFGSQQKTDAERRFLGEDWTKFNKQRLTPAGRTLVLDAYDSCLAYLDECLGALIDNLDRRGLLDQTLVIVTGDHGEGLGEHGLFDHGESLYRTELHVPLLIRLPASHGDSRVVVEPFVSLRDLPATVVDLVGPGTGSPFPGRSLMRFWASDPETAPGDEAQEVLSELAAPNPSDPNQGRAPSHRGPLISLADGAFVYIRNEGDGSEHLFNDREDPGEVVDFARAEAMNPVLQRFRDLLARGRAPGRANLDKSHQSRNIRESALAKLLGQPP